MVEILQEMKRRLGKDFPIGVHYNAAEYGIDDGITPAEGQEFGRIFEAAGADNLHPKADGLGPIYKFMNWPDTVCYPEVPAPLPEGLDGSGAGQILVPLVHPLRRQFPYRQSPRRINAELAENILQQGKRILLA